MTRREMVRHLARRRDFLRVRVDQAKASGKDLTFDKAEIAALSWAIELAEADLLARPPLQKSCAPKER